MRFQFGMRGSQTRLFLTFVPFALLIVGLCFPLAAEHPLAGLPVVGSLPESPGTDAFSFAILGDKTSGGEGKWPIFDRAVDEINLLAPEFVITVGDQIPGHMQDRARWDAEWAEYLEHARRLAMPLVLIPGNHDIANVECYEFWKEDFGRTYFSFDYRGCHFLVLNTEEERFDGRGPIWEAMMGFAESDLAAHREARHTFVFFHKPMWDDPRFEADWARLAKALGMRPYTAVAGHEHYLMTERRDGHLLVVQSATGAGISLSKQKAMGDFHSFAQVTVTGTEAHYAVVEPDGGIWPPEIAPASFRKAISYEVLRLDAEKSEDLAADEVAVNARVELENVFDVPISVEVLVAPLDRCGWKANPETNDGALLITRALAPGARDTASLPFLVPQDRLVFPPHVSWRVQYAGEWLENESYNMSQENVIPIYTAGAMRIVPEWQVVGPFLLGDIDESQLPEHPAAANPKLFEAFGPEEGYRAEAEYEGGRRWATAPNQGRGLLNFNGLMGTLDHALGYAACVIHSPERQRVHALLYADNFVQTVLNGRLLENGQSFGAPGGFIWAPLDLQAGENRLVLKLINNHGDWFLRALIADPRGNLQFTSK